MASNLQLARESVALYEERKGRERTAKFIRQGIYDSWERVQCSLIALNLVNTETEKGELVMENVVRILSTGALISSAQFNKLSATDQTKVLISAKDAKTILFVDNFSELRSAKKLREKLLAGEDVSMELEFNNISLTQAELAAVAAIRPVLKKIGGLKPTEYQWSDDSSVDILKGKFNYLGETYKQTKSGHYFQIDTVKTVWKEASQFWLDGTLPTVKKIKAYQSTYEFSVTAEGVKVGCEFFPRNIVEAMARRFKLAAPKPE